MRKYVIGFVFGVLLSLSFNASAAVESLIGKAVDNEYVVKVEGRELERKAVSVDGSSYAPVRVIAESLGLDVMFDNNEVLLSKPQKGVETKMPDTQTREEKDRQARINNLNDKIDVLNLRIIGTRMAIDGKMGSEEYRSEMQKKLIDLEAELADLERQKAELQK